MTDEWREAMTSRTGTTTTGDAGDQTVIQSVTQSVVTGEAVPDLKHLCLKNPLLSTLDPHSHPLPLNPRLTNKHCLVMAGKDAPLESQGPAYAMIRTTGGQVYKVPMSALHGKQLGQQIVVKTEAKAGIIATTGATIIWMRTTPPVTSTSKILASSTTQSLVAPLTTTLETVSAIPPSGPMSGLPDEILRHILSFAPIDSVISAMRVDRKWEQAARYEIKHRKSLSISSHGRCEACRTAVSACQSCRRGRFRNGIIYMDTRDDFSALAFIMKMQRLERLDADDFPVEVIGLLIIQNANTLRVVSGIFKLPVAAPVVYEKMVELECSDFDKETSVACPNLSVLKITDQPATRDSERLSLEKPLPSVRFPNLVHFRSHEESEREAADFIAIHAHQLKKMRYYGMYPLEYKGRDVMYTELEEAIVDLSRMEQDVACVLKHCPKLQRLKVMCFDDDADLSHLPIDCMRSLVLCFRAYEDAITERTFQHMFESVSRLQNLTTLKIIISLSGAQLLTGENRKNYNILIPLFDELHHLKDVKIAVWGDAVDMDLLIDRLVRGNPFLQTLTLSGVRLTDPVIESMSRLSHLQSLTLKPGDHLSTKYLLKLTAGASAASLKQLEVMDAEGVDLDRVEEAFVLMLTERGLTANHENWKKDPEKHAFCFSC